MEESKLLDRLCSISHWDVIEWLPPDGIALVSLESGIIDNQAVEIVIVWSSLDTLDGLVSFCIAKVGLFYPPKITPSNRVRQVRFEGRRARRLLRCIMSTIPEAKE